MAGIACGIIGLPNVGKSTLFNCLTRAGAAVANYPFCTIDPNVGVVDVPDSRLDRLNSVEKRPKQIPAVVEFIDIAGLVEGASKGEGRGNQFLANIHHADALVHVVRCFHDADVAHARPELDPVEDIRTINLELILADLQTAQQAFDGQLKRARGAGDKDAKTKCAVLERLQAHFDSEHPARNAPLSAADWDHVSDWRFLTRKPVLYVANVGEGDLPSMDSPFVRQIAEFARGEGNVVVPVCAQIESELAELEGEEAEEFREALGLEESGLDRLVRECYRHLGLITFLTVGDEEVRAWTIRRGAKAPQAGGVIHTDFQERFIRAEVVHFADFDHYGSRGKAREAGLMHTEGKDYVVQDGDILYFRIGR